MNETAPDLAALIADTARSASEDLSRVIAERIRLLEPALRSQMEQSAAAAASEGRKTGAQESATRIVTGWSRYFGRMRQFQSDRSWCDALLDATAEWCESSAFFSIRGGRLCFQGARGISAPQAVPEVPLDQAPAFLAAAAGSDTIFCLRTRRDLSGPIAALAGESQDARVALVPIRLSGRVAGVVYAEGVREIAAIQSIASVAGATLEAHLLKVEAPEAPRTAPRSVLQELRPAATVQKVRVPSRSLDDPRHAAARRFARVAVARILLDNYGAVREGRESRNLYASLRASINRARDDYQTKFLTGDLIPDFLHEELVRSLARTDAGLLGPDYPGALR